MKTRLAFGVVLLPLIALVGCATADHSADPNGKVTGDRSAGTFGETTANPDSAQTGFAHTGAGLGADSGGGTAGATGH